MSTEFDENTLQEALDSGKPVLVDFWAPWCGPCRQMGPTIEALATAYEGKVVVGKVNIDDQQDLAERYEVSSIPLILLLQGGKELWRQTGACRADIIKPEINKALRT